MNLKNQVFSNIYSSAYDTLYKEKDYVSECDFLEKIFKANGRPIKNILDLGCGTGGHAIILAKRGYHVTGVDVSVDMLRVAQQKALEEKVNIEFIQSSIQNFQSAKKFDAVVSMFAVIGYLSDNSDLKNGIQVVRECLIDGGPFVFDVWNGFAVLNDKPKPKVKKIQDGHKEIIRTTSVIFRWLENVVDIKFDLSITKENNIFTQTQETHSMRFFFPKELDFILKQAGFGSVALCPFLEYGHDVKEDDWNLTVIAK